MTPTPKPPAPYETWAELLLTRSPVSSHEWARVEDGMSEAKQFEFARAELEALRSECDELQAWKSESQRAWREMLDLLPSGYDRASIQEPQP